MANALYARGRNKFLTGNIAWLTDNIKGVLVDYGAYTVNLTTHEFLSDIAVGARIATSPNLANKTAVDGVADADDITFPNVTGPTGEAVVLYKDTGVDSTSPLIGIIDSATNLPIIPNSGPIAVQWDNGANKIFKL